MKTDDDHLYEYWISILRIIINYNLFIGLLVIEEAIKLVQLINTTKLQIMHLIAVPFSDSYQLLLVHNLRRIHRTWIVMLVRFYQRHRCPP